MSALPLIAPEWQEQGIIPVLTLEHAADAVPLTQALVRAGLPIIEITLRSPAALEAITLAASVAGAQIGAGSLRRPADMEAALAAGARFLVSPGATPALLREGFAAPVPYFPGCATASDMLCALEAGFTCVKFFPAETLGGARALAALAAPLPEMRFMPTGGIGPGNLAQYRALACVVAVGGSWMVPKEALATGDFAQIEALARQARHA